MKTLYLLCSRIRQYIIKNKAMFVFFVLGGMFNGIMLTYSYGNLLGTVATRESQSYRYREYVVNFFDKKFEPEQLDSLLANPMVDYARVIYNATVETPGYGAVPDKVEIVYNITPYVENLPLYHATDASAPQGKIFEGASKLNGPYECFVGADLDKHFNWEGDWIGLDAGWGAEPGRGTRFKIVGTCMNFLRYTYIIPLETFYEMGLHGKTKQAYVYAKERQDFETGEDAMEKLLRETFPGCTIVKAPRQKYTQIVKETLLRFPLIMVSYLITAISYIFLLRYIVDSSMKESIISIIVGAPKSAITLTIFWEATVMSLLANGLGLLLHATLYNPFFKNLNIDESMTYYLSDYLYIFLMIMIITLAVTVPFVMKYMKLSPIAARRAKH